MGPWGGSRPLGVLVGGGTIKSNKCEYFGVFARSGNAVFPQGLGFVIILGLFADSLKDAESCFEPLAEKLLGRFCRTVRIDPEYGDVLIPGFRG